jgi:tyrosyl-tRNA synthetase
MPGKLDIKSQVALIKKRVVSLETERELEDRLKEGRPLRVKLGADPSAPDLHLGHTVVLNKLRVFQDLGHEVIFIIGDFTARIGDPSGRSKTRQQLSTEEIERNAETYKQQVFKILDPAKTKVVFNSSWLEKLKFVDVINLASKSTVAQMLQRDDYANRYASNIPISLHEFLYPLAQGYDSIQIHADVEIGGTDQTFNLLLARELQKTSGQKPQVTMTMPILVGLDGVEKMSKSLGNHIGIMEPPYEMFGKIMSISDEMMPTYYELLTDLNYEKERKNVGHPKLLKLRLADEITRVFHGDEAAERSRRNFELTYGKKGIPEDGDWVKTGTIESGEYWLPQLIKDFKLANSTSEARRLIRQGAVSIDGDRVLDEHAKIQFKKGGKNPELIKVGKKKFVKFKLHA